MIWYHSGDSAVGYNPENHRAGKRKRGFVMFSFFYFLSKPSKRFRLYHKMRKKEWKNKK